MLSANAWRSECLYDVEIQDSDGSGFGSSDTIEAGMDGTPVVQDHEVRKPYCGKKRKKGRNNSWSTTVVNVNNRCGSNG